jgi:glycosyltransferase involved in cell wall biosynthesis
MWPRPDRPESGIFVSDQADALRKAGVDLEVFAFQGGSGLAYLKAAWQLRRVHKGRFDVVHAHFGLSAWVALAARAKIRAVTFHGTDLTHQRSRRISLAVLRFIDLPAAASAELAELVPSDQTRNRNPVNVLPCGLATDRFAPADMGEARAQLCVDPQAKLLLLPADPSRPEKRADRASQLAESAGATLLTLGGVRPDQVATYMNACDAVVIPSEREGFGLALLEALACNRPVLSTPNGIAPAALDDLPATLCAEWDLETWTQALTQILATGAEPAGRERVAPWSADACAAKVIDAWQAALAAA